jgi:RNA methyltransferase, TrmH family
VSLLTLTRDLRRRKARDRHTRCVVEGVRAVEEVLAAGVTPVGVLLGPDADATPRAQALRDALAARGVPQERVDARDFASAADTDSPQGVLAVVPVPERALADVPTDGPVLLLDAVQDPGNVGTLVRSAAALGAAATIALPGTVDLWNAKTIRSAVGAQFRHLALHAAWDDVAAWLAQRDLPLWGADLTGVPVAEWRPSGPVALALGNEGNGLTPMVAAACTGRVTIPITGAAESLNVAVAGGILLQQLRAVC